MEKIVSIGVPARAPGCAELSDAYETNLKVPRLTIQGFLRPVTSLGSFEEARSILISGLAQRFPAQI